MENVICVNVDSRDLTMIVEARGTIGGTSRALLAPRTRPKSVESCKLALSTAQKAVLHIVSIDVASRNHPRQIEAQITTGTPCALVQARARARNVVSRQLSLRTSQQAVINKVAAIVLVASRRDSKKIDVGCSRTETTIRLAVIARSGTNPRRKRAVGATEKSMEIKARVGVVAYNGSLQVQGYGKGAKTPAPVTSNVVKFPSGLRRNPWLKPFASE